MRGLTVVSVLILSRFVATAAADPAISDASGLWNCLLDRSGQPQIQIDFTEMAYRRCDQHICSTYDLAPVEAVDTNVRIVFGGIGTFVASVDGQRYTETVTVGEARVVNHGHCEHRAADGGEPTRS